MRMATTFAFTCTTAMKIEVAPIFLKQVSTAPIYVGIRTPLLGSPLHLSLTPAIRTTAGVEGGIFGPHLFGKKRITEIGHRHRFEAG